MQIIRNTICALGGVAFAAMLASTAAAQTTTGVTDDEILIGIFSPLSGPFAPQGIDPVNAAKSYFDDVNEKGGINGRKIKYIVEDDKCIPAETGAIARKFINVDKVFAILGGSCSGATLSIQELVNQEKIPHLMLNASGDTAVFPPTEYQYGSAPGTQRATLGAVMTYAIDNLGAKTVAVLGPDDATGAAAMVMINAVAEKRGIKVLTRGDIPNNATDVTVPVLEARSANADVLILTTYPQPTYLVMKKLVEFGMLDKPIISAIQGVASPEVFLAGIDGDKTGLKNFYYAHPLVGETMDDPNLKPWKDLMVKHYPDRPNPGIIAAYGFPHAMAIVKALEASGRDVSREKFMAELDKLEFDSQVMAAPTKFAPGRRDSNRGNVIVKFDGDTITRVGGPYIWDEIIDPSVFAD